MSLIQKYNRPVPRYTSYPTVPYWEEESFTAEKWEASAALSFVETNATEGISLYIHLPFCERLCTFCGCTKRITRNHAVEQPYIHALLKEWGMYLTKWGGRPVIRDLHIGGGSPTFFDPQNLKTLIQGLLANADRHPQASFSFEANPVTARREHLAEMRSLGFDRISLGIQDFDPEVQQMINRVQPYETVAQVTSWAREFGYRSVNFDVVFGLPLQTEQSIHDTFQKIRSLRPDRIAYYSYAHVPWIKGNGMRRFTESDLPKGAAKRKLYEIGQQYLEEMGYDEIGMDHFALPTDGLYEAFTSGRLHRNFMGYVEDRTDLMIGLGMSSISDSWYGFAQNEKKLEDYYARLERDELPVFRGHILTNEDLEIRQHILSLMCQMETSWDVTNPSPTLQKALIRLDELEKDGLIVRSRGRLRITETGRPFVRNICMAFDQRLWDRKPDSQLFSMSI